MENIRTRLSALSTMRQQTSAFGERLSEERKALGLSKTAFAARLGIHRNTQGNYESGAREPEAAYLAAAAGVGIDVGYVLTGTRADFSHRVLVHLVGVVFDTLGLTKREKEFWEICQQALAGLDGLGAYILKGTDDADHATAALIAKSPVVLVEALFTDLIERVEFVLESSGIQLEPHHKARAILKLYAQAKSQEKPLDLSSIRAVLETNR